MQEFILEPNSMPVLKTISVELNDDGTYTVTHVLTNKEYGEIKVEFPRVEMTIDYMPKISSPLPPVIPFSKCEVLKVAEDDDRMCIMSVSHVPLPLKKREWCDNQEIDNTGNIICLAHLAEGRALNCPYKNNKNRLLSQYPCADYKPKE